MHGMRYSGFPAWTTVVLNRKAPQITICSKLCRENFWTKMVILWMENVLIIRWPFTVNSQHSSTLVSLGILKHTAGIFTTNFTAKFVHTHGANVLSDGWFLFLILSKETARSFALNCHFSNKLFFRKKSRKRKFVHKTLKTQMVAMTHDRTDL